MLVINYLKSRKSTEIVKDMLRKSRFNRRFHQIRDLIVYLFFQLSSLIKELNISSEYSSDSFPKSTCDNIRIANSKLIPVEYTFSRFVQCKAHL